MICGEEICPNTGKLHWQTYMEFNTPVRIAAIKKMFNDNTIHVEKRMGTRDQAKEYCMKDNKYAEYGKWIKGQGHRTDLETVAEDLISGRPLKEIMMENPTVYCRYRNGLKDIAAEATKVLAAEWREVEVILLSGPTGCGKTREAMKEATYKIQGSQLQWWQDYDRDNVICIDEYNNNLQIDELLALLDGYKLRLNCKGSHTYAMWDKVYITTNLRPEELHANAKPAHRAALFRRITTVKNKWYEEVQG